MHPIKTVYNFVVTIQILFLIYFIFALIEYDITFTYPIIVKFTIPMPTPFDDLEFNFDYELTFSQSSLELMLIAMGLIFLISSINVAGSGQTDSGTITLKQIISFISKYILLSLPVVFLLSQSDILQDYIALIGLIMLVIYVLSFLIDMGEEKNAI